MDPLAELASKVKGRYEPGGLRTGPRISFLLEGRPALLDRPGLDSEAESAFRLGVDLDGCSPGALKIYPEGFGFPLARLFGAQDVRIGDRAFDALYVVKSNPESLARTFFEGERREALVASVRDLGKYLGMVVDLSRHRLRVQVSEFYVTEALLERLLRAAREFTAAALALAGSVPVFWEEAAPGGRCPVCASPLGGGIARCAKCATPHHRECWDYAGGCSTYACGGTRPA
jgi:hypothetical protein